MASSVEYLVEAQAMALLAANGDLSAVDIKHQQDDTNSASTVSRIIVACAEKMAFLGSRKANEAPIFWEAQVTVTAKSMNGTSSVDAWIAAIDKAISGQTSGYVRFYPSSGGGIAEGVNDRREGARTFRAIFSATL